MEEIFSVYACKDCGNTNGNELDFDYKTSKHAVVCISCKARRQNKPKVDFYIYEKIEAAKKKAEDKKREESAAELDKIAETYKADWYGIAHYPED